MVDDNINTSALVRSLTNRNQAPIRMKVNELRPHFYHVICYDLLMETIAERAENVKKIS